MVVDSHVVLKNNSERPTQFPLMATFCQVIVHYHKWDFDIHKIHQYSSYFPYFMCAYVHVCVGSLLDSFSGVEVSHIQHHIQDSERCHHTLVRLPPSLNVANHYSVFSS